MPSRASHSAMKRRSQRGEQRTGLAIAVTPAQVFLERTMFGSLM